MKVARRPWRWMVASNRPFLYARPAFSDCAGCAGALRRYVESCRWILHSSGSCRVVVLSDQVTVKVRLTAVSCWRSEARKKASASHAGVVTSLLTREETCNITMV